MNKSDAATQGAKPPIRLFFKNRSIFLRVTSAIAVFSYIAIPGIRYDWQSPELYLVLGLLGGFFACLGCAIRFWGCLYIGGRKNRKLVTDGPYSLIRNPLYLGNMVSAFGVCILTNSILVTIFVMFSFGLIWSATILGEELRLREIFGDVYGRYLKSTPRWYPRLAGIRSLLQNSEPIEISHAYLRREVKNVLFVFGSGLSVVVVGMFIR